MLKLLLNKGDTMDDKSFVSLLNEDILEKINIDAELIESFKRVIRKIQEYFNSNGYTLERDYGKFFNDYLINSDTTKNLRIYLNEEPRKIGANGFYTTDGKTICIDRNVLKNNDALDATLFHEFIHFLVMRNLIVDKTADPAIKYGIFINEALTEMLTRQLYPKSNAYEPQVKMMEFANMLSNKVNNYSLFLKGKIDAKGYGAASWNNFVELAQKYQKQMQGKPFHLREAQNNEFYLKAQRYLIDSKISVHRITTFTDYAEKIKILLQRPALDEEYIENFISKMDESLINNLGLKNKNMQELNKSLLKEYREILTRRLKYGEKDIYYFEIVGHTLGIDKDLKLYGADGFVYSSSWNPATKMFVLNMENETVKLDLNAIDFKAQRDLDAEKEQKIAKWFSNDASKDIKRIEEVADNNLVRLEKFTLPVIENLGKKKPIIVYVATYGDKIKVLNDLVPVGVYKDIKSFKYMGVTSLDPKVGAIYVDPLGTIAKGYVYLNMSEKFKHAKELNLYTSEIKSTLMPEQLTDIVSQYKSSTEYELNDLDEEDLQDFALKHYAEEEYKKLSDLEKERFAIEATQGQEKVVVAENNEAVEVSLLFGNKNQMALKGKKEVLVSKLEDGLYNEYYMELQNNKRTIDNHQKIIGNVEKLLGFQITEVAGYNYDSAAVPQIVLKDVTELNAEQSRVLNSLKELRDSGKIDLVNYNLMKEEVIKEYTRLIVSVSRSEKSISR